jgi:hypothetical protein
MEHSESLGDEGMQLWKDGMPTVHTIENLVSSLISENDASFGERLQLALHSSHTYVHAPGDLANKERFVWRAKQSAQNASPSLSKQEVAER